jgi:hypothetical protein
VQASARAQMAARVRAQAVAGGAAFVLAVVAFTALANGAGEARSRGGLSSQLAQTTSKLGSFERKLNSDKSRLQTVIHRLGQIKSAEAQIKQEQAELLAKERKTRDDMHEARNKVVSLKYKIHNMKAVAFSNAMFGLSGKSEQQARARTRLERKARRLEGQREQEVRDEDRQTGPRNVKREVSHVLRVDAGHAAQHPALRRAAQSLHTRSGTRASNAAGVIAAGLKKTLEQANNLRNEARSRAAARLQQKAQTLEKERDAREKQRKQREAEAIAREAAEMEAKARRVNAAKAAAKERRDVSRMQAEVLRRRVATIATPKPAARVPSAHRDTPSERAAQHRPLSLSEAADLAAKRAQQAQQMAFMRSPQYWSSQQVPHTTKIFGNMPALPLLAPLDPAVADK